MSNNTTLLDTIASNQANKEVVVNALLDAASPSMLWGRHASACGGLTWGYYGGTFVDSTGAAHAIANGTVTLAASITNYLFADGTTGALSANTTGFPAGKVPLYSIVAGASTVTSYTDARSYQPSATAGAGGAGTVTSVALTAPAMFTVGGSPVTGSGTLALTLVAQAVNRVFAGPSSGGSAAPGFRALVAADLPVFVASGASHAAGAVPDPGATAGTTRFMREDATWAVPAGGGGSTTLAALTDVSVVNSSASDLYVFRYSNSLTKWTGSPLVLTPIAAATIDPAVTPAGVTLSGGNLTATNTLSAWVGTRSTGPHTSGKWYAELTVNTLGGTNAFGFGICDASETLASGFIIGSDTHGIIMYNNLGGPTSGVFYNGGVVGSIGTPLPVAGAVVGVALDMTLKKIWFYNPSAGQWNGAAIGSQNPATGTGGIDVTTILAAGNVYLAIALSNSGAVVTLNAGASAFSNAVPSGFSGWAIPAVALIRDLVISAPTNGQVLSYNASAGNWQNSSAPYDLLMFSPGVPGNSALMARVVIPRIVTLPISLTGSYASATVAATAATTLTLAKNGSSIGTVNFALGATVGTFTFSSAVTTAAGDVLTVTNQATADATLANVSITLAATR
jgi:hypothetical protein